MCREIRHGSLFSGIGGFDLAAEWMDWRNVFNCEIDPFCRRVLKYYWPHTHSYADIHTFPADQYRGLVDVITGGFPCQPFSIAGARKGTDDPRYLWPQMFGIISAIRPRFVVAENVPYLIGWQRGLVFDQVYIDLESAGYQVASVVLPACGKNAPHIRNRVWFVAYTGSIGQLGHCTTENSIERFNRRKARGHTHVAGTFGNVADTSSPRLEGTAGASVQGKAGRSGRGVKIPAWTKWPTQPGVCSGDDGILQHLVDISFSEWRTAAVHALGNSIVPQIAYEIFKVIGEWIDNDI